MCNEITLCFRMPGMLVNVSMCVYCLAEITFFSPIYIRAFASTSISVSTCGKIPWLWSYFTGFIMTCKRCFFQLAPKKFLVNWDPLYSISPYAPLSHQETHKVNIISHRPSKIRCHLLYYRQFFLQMIWGWLQLFSWVWYICKSFHSETSSIFCIFKPDNGQTINHPQVCFLILFCDLILSLEEVNSVQIKLWTSCDLDFPFTPSL